MFLDFNLRTCSVYGHLKWAKTLYASAFPQVGKRIINQRNVLEPMWKSILPDSYL
jgi:hypothetical protein